MKKGSPTAFAKGLSVLQGDINDEVADYPDASFDYVILSQTLQQVFAPAELIRAMLRHRPQGDRQFLNFCHWGIRLQLLFSGYAPVSKQLPYQWFDTPNIRVITLKDFRKFVYDVGLSVLKRGRHQRQPIPPVPGTEASFSSCRTCARLTAFS